MPPAPLALEAVRRIDAIFAHAREINGRSAELRLAGRREHAALLVAAFATWMRSERPRLSRHAPVARAMDSHEEGPSQAESCQIRAFESSDVRVKPFKVCGHAASTHIRSSILLTIHYPAYLRYGLRRRVPTT